ncbi:retrovirus-related pol polyprotein from transposon TNT 1-94, partial [Tanacetum coccineum]
MELKHFLLDFGFRKSFDDASLFVYNHHGITIYFMMYVDDIVLTGSNNDFSIYFVDKLASRFSFKDLGTLHHFLGIEVISTSQGLFLSQHRHITYLLTQFHMDGAKEVVIPLNSVDKLSIADDVSFAVNKLSQFMHAPTKLHFQSLKRGGINDGGRSTTAYVIYLGSNIISWRFARQKSVSRSSTEAEYKALANAAAEISW